MRGPIRPAYLQWRASLRPPSLGVSDSLLGATSVEAADIAADRSPTQSLYVIDSRARHGDEPSRSCRCAVPEGSQQEGNPEIDSPETMTVRGEIVNALDTLRERMKG